MAGVKARAAERVAGLSAEQYIHESILKPGAYIVPGFRDLMFADYARYLNQQDIADLQAYLTGLSP
jgi:hypothetical protein